MAQAREPDLNPAIGWVRVSSSNVEAIRWSERVLYVKFLAKGKSPGSTYAYYGVPRSVAVQMLDSGSKGTFVWDRLRDEYRYERIA